MSGNPKLTPKTEAKIKVLLYPKPQLTEGQELLLKQAQNCRNVANVIRSHADNYDQNNACLCTFHYMRIVLGSAKGELMGLNNSREVWQVAGFGKDYLPEENIYRCSHDGTPNGAAGWLEAHATKLEAQV